MSNYVYNMIICRKEIFYKYFFDEKAFEKDNKFPTISFNKLFNVKSVEEYSDKIGTTISYGFGFSFISNVDGTCAVKFQTQNFYPIEAILKAVEMFHDLEWYAVEDPNYVYVSHFYWGDKVKENILYVHGEYDDWRIRNIDYDDSLFEENDADCGAWYFLRYCSRSWREWECNDLLSRYRNIPVHKIKYPFAD